MQVPYEFIGKIAIYLGIFTLALILLAMSISAYSYKKKKILFPTFTLLILDLFYSPAKIIAGTFNMKDTLIDEIMIEFRNAILLDKFKQVKENKILFGPKCIRHPKCPARCDPKIGYICIGCGKCEYAQLKKECEKYNYKIFILPGTTFVKKIYKEYKPKGAIGIGCYRELNETMQKMAYVLPGQGVPLLNDGCFNTKIDIDCIIEKMRL